MTSQLKPRPLMWCVTLTHRASCQCSGVWRMVLDWRGHKVGMMVLMGFLLYLLLVSILFSVQCDLLVWYSISIYQKIMKAKRNMKIENKWCSTIKLYLLIICLSLFLSLALPLLSSLYHLVFLDVQFSVRFWVTGLRLGGLSQTHWRWSRSRCVFPKCKALYLDAPRPTAALSSDDHLCVVWWCLNEALGISSWLDKVWWQCANYWVSPLRCWSHWHTQGAKVLFCFFREIPLPLPHKVQSWLWTTWSGTIYYDDFLARDTVPKINKFIYIYIFFYSIIYE